MPHPLQVGLRLGRIAIAASLALPLAGLAATAPQSSGPAPVSRPAASVSGPANANANANANSRTLYDSYILGPGDALQIELLDIPELSGTYSIGPDGTLYLPRLRALYVQGLTIEELRYFLTQQFKKYVKNPQIFIQSAAYRPIRIYVGGEVRRPGYYTLTSQQPQLNQKAFTTQSNIPISQQTDSNNPGISATSPPNYPSNPGANWSAPGLGILPISNPWPTVFDAIQSAQGITAFSDLSSIEVTRHQAISNGGGKIRTNLDFVKLITAGDDSQNIRLFDGDVVLISKSPTILKEQLLKAGQSNLSPQYLEVYVSGRVKRPGTVVIPQGSSLNQAMIAAGGLQLLRGKIEFVRFTKDGEVDRRLINYQAGAPSGSRDNPFLMSGDIINVQESILSAASGLLNEFTGPFVGLYSVYSLFK